MKPIPKSGALHPHAHAGPTIEAMLRASFRLLVALAIMAIGAGAFLALALGAERSSG